MAKNLDVNIDTGNFLESFRPEMPPPASRKGNGAATKEESVKDDTAAIKERQPETRSAKQPTASVFSSNLCFC